MKITKKTATVQEFANILGVDRTTVTKAIASKRLDKSVVEGSSPKQIEIYEGCIEWYLKKHMEKDRFGKNRSDIEASKARHEYYRSLLTKLDYEIKTGEYIPFKEVGQAGAEIVLEAKQFLLDSRYKHALKLLPINDAFDMEKAVKERDYEFLNALAKLRDTDKQVADKSAAVQREDDEAKS